MDLWNHIQPFADDDPLARDIVHLLRHTYPENKRKLLVTTEHHRVLGSIVEYCREQGVPTLILCASQAAQERWNYALSLQLSNPALAAHIMRPPAPDDVAPFSILPYSYFCNPFHANTDQRLEARRRIQHGIASVPDKDPRHMISFGDIDALAEADSFLDDYAIRHFSSYMEGLSCSLRSADLGSDVWLSCAFATTVQQLKNAGIGFIIADGVHHLGCLWIKILQRLEQQLGANVLGLSTMLPDAYVGDRQSIEDRQNFFGSRYTELKTPYLSAHGCCRPWRELLHITSPDETDKQLINDTLMGYQVNINLANNPDYVSTTLRDFCLHELALLEHDIPGNWARRRERLESALYYAREQLLPLSRGTWELFLAKIPKDQFDLNLPVLRSYIFKHLICDDASPQERELGDLILQQLRYLGYELSHDGHKVLSSRIMNILSRANARQQGAVAILSREFAANGPNLRALAICDFTDSSLAATASNLPDPTLCGSLSLFSALLEDPITSQLNPIALWNHTLYSTARFHKVMVNAICDIIQVYGEDITFSSSESPPYMLYTFDGPGMNGAVWHWIVGQLLERQACFCLIGTRELINPDWDGLPVNTLINLTTSSSRAFSERLQRRLTEVPHQDTLPAAHLWDISCALPGVKDGLSMIELLRTRKNRSWNICEDGIFELGLGHITPLLENPALDEQTLQFINHQQLGLIEHREFLRESWVWLGAHHPKSFQAFHLQFDPGTARLPLMTLQIIQLRQRTALQVSYPKLIAQIMDACAAACCDLHKKTWHDNFIRIDALVRSADALRVIVICEDNSFRELVRSSIEQLMAPISTQHYGMLVNAASPIGQIQGAFPVPEAFNDRKKLTYLLTRWQEFVGQDEPVSLRLPETRQRIDHFSLQQGCELRPTLFSSRIWLPTS